MCACRCEEDFRGFPPGQTKDACVDVGAFVPPPPTGEGEGACLSVDVGAFAASNTDGGRGRMFSCECRRICTSLIRGEEDVYVDMWM